jgi:pSer/pThr/pTyr-binding forkhead associated (FHA) protein
MWTLEGPNGLVWTLNAAGEVGRTPGLAFSLNDPSMSGRHAKLELLGQNLFVSDLGSTNGTFVNGVQVTAATKLEVGDRVSFGLVNFQVNGPTPVAPPPNLVSSGTPGLARTVRRSTGPQVTLLRSDGTELTVSSPFLIGRDAANSLVLNDVQASGLHARIDLLMGRISISDLGSTNKTQVNGVAINQPTELRHGDRICIGDTILRVREDGREFETEAAVPTPLASRTGPVSRAPVWLGGLLAALILSVVAVGFNLQQRAERDRVEAQAALQKVQDENATKLQAMQAQSQAAARQAAKEAISQGNKTIQAAERRALTASVLVGVETTSGGQSGSGTFVSTKGHILTNDHVIRDDAGNLSDNILVAWNMEDLTGQPNTIYTAHIVESNPNLDLALLQIDDLQSGTPIEGKIPALEIGDSAALSPGDPITVIGYPGIGGSTRTLTRGTLSGRVADDRASLERGWMKTDTVIAHGNSGGTAVNPAGELIGVPTAGRQDYDGGANIGLIRPISFAKELLRQAR